jgi:ferredoxin-NADP reductase/bacterioferritin-associated ferredoxin
VACQCAGVTFLELDEAVAGDRNATVEVLGAALGCGVQCGSCIPALREALGQVAWFAATATATPITRSRDLEGLERLIFRVDIALADAAAFPRALPGQHVVLRADTGQGVIERTYTVVSQDVAARRLTLGVRRKPGGRMTPWLLDAADDPVPRRIEVSAPGGSALGSGGRRPDMFFAAGVGVTPAAAMANALPPAATMHLHYSALDADDAAFVPEFEARRKDRPNFSYTLRETAHRGPITQAKIGILAARYRDAQFHVCGPEGYVALVHRALKRAGVPAGRIHVELFALTTARTAVRTSRAKAWLAGACMALLPFALLLPGLEQVRPHGHPNVGHAELKCASCHVESPASTRQAFQAKVKHAIGWRQTGAVLGMQPVTSATCIQCHANSDDRHAPNRFLEPRFAQARAETGAQQCVSCHREHSAVRVTAPSTGYCVSCHQDLKVKDDKASPTHDYLVRNKQWTTCLQCHDYHGNHRWNAPLRLQDAATLEVLNKYLQGGPSPFGAAIVKARQGKPG